MHIRLCYSTVDVTEFTPCNRSLGVGICPLSYQCYQLFKTCDGIVDCIDGYDEIACKCQVYFSVLHFLRNNKIFSFTFMQYSNITDCKLKLMLFDILHSLLLYVINRV